MPPSNTNTSESGGTCSKGKELHYRHDFITNLDRKAKCSLNAELGPQRPMARKRVILINIRHPFWLARFPNAAGERLTQLEPLRMHFLSHRRIGARIVHVPDLRSDQFFLVFRRQENVTDRPARDFTHHVKAVLQHILKRSRRRRECARLLQQSRNLNLSLELLFEFLARANIPHKTSHQRGAFLG